MLVYFYIVLLIADWKEKIKNITTEDILEIYLIEWKEKINMTLAKALLRILACRVLCVGVLESYYLAS